MAIKIKGLFRPTGSLKLGALTSVDPPVVIEDPKAPQWVTSPGYLATFAEDEEVDYAIVASDPNDDIQTYEVIDGELPNGLSLNLFSGHLVGTVGSVLQDTRYNFTIRVTDSSDLTLDGTFEVLIINEATVVTWDTPSGTVGEAAPGEEIPNGVEASSV